MATRTSPTLKAPCPALQAVNSLPGKFLAYFLQNLRQQSSSSQELNPWQLELIEKLQQGGSHSTDALEDLYRLVYPYYERLIEDPVTYQSQCYELLLAFLDNEHLTQIAPSLSKSWIKLFLGLAFGPFANKEDAGSRARPKVISLDMIIISKLITTLDTHLGFYTTEDFACSLARIIPRIHFSALQQFAPTVYDLAKENLLLDIDTKIIDPLLKIAHTEFFLKSIGDGKEEYAKISYYSSAWLLLSIEDQQVVLQEAIRFKCTSFLDFIAEDYPDSLLQTSLDTGFSVTDCLSLTARGSLLLKAVKSNHADYVRYILENHPDTLTAIDLKTLCDELTHHGLEDLLHVVSAIQASMYLFPIQNLLSQSPITWHSLQDLYTKVSHHHELLMQNPMTYQKECNELLSVLLDSPSFKAALDAESSPMSTILDFASLLLGLVFGPFTASIHNTKRHQVTSLDMSIITKLLNHPLLRAFSSKDPDIYVCSGELSNLIGRLYFSRLSERAQEIYDLARELGLLRAEDDCFITTITSLSLPELFLQSIQHHARQDGGTIEQPLISYCSSAWLLLSIEDQQMLLIEAKKCHCRQFLMFIQQEYPDTLLALEMQSLKL